jgi:hypothetical protein
MPVELNERSAVEAATMRRVTLRIIPFLMLCYFIAFVDRVNAGFAALQMNHDIGLSAAAFGLGGGLFYISYVICEVPSNLAMAKVGARIRIARIMISWGIVAGCMALVAQVNAIGNLGGFFGSYVLGAIKDATGSYALGLMPLAVLSAIGCVLVLVLSRHRGQGATTVLSGVH